MPKCGDDKDDPCTCLGLGPPRASEFWKRRADVWQFYTAAAILKASDRGECHRCGRTLPPPAPVAGRLMPWRYMNAADRKVTEYIGQPRDWMTRFGGERFSVSSWLPRSETTAAI